MKYFYVIPNWAKDPSGEAANRIKEYLESKGCVCDVRVEHMGDVALEAGMEHRGCCGCQVPRKTWAEASDRMEETKQVYKYTNPAEIPAATQCVIVIGGDGTLIQATRDLVDLDLPFVGVNLGTLGYLAELEIQNIHESLDALIEDKYVVQERMMLSGTLIRDGNVLEENIALNEVVVGRGCALNVIRFRVSVNDRFLNSYAADGVIIGTPTGSTGYNLSAGGPILEPDSSMILLTPISPHSMINRSIVLADTAEVEIEMTRIGAGGALLAFDGSGSVAELADGDRLKIRKSEKKTKILTLSRESFLEILRNKMSGE
ncbi:MAG: NAD(+)/NADH kinase [Lachnospiraceae bacterium]|nr:NAD(+)/NADH kinase [Lachnospiraceae bacterium]